MNVCDSRYEEASCIRALHEVFPEARLTLDLRRVD